jgi:hypothetical protein
LQSIGIPYAKKRRSEWGVRALSSSVFDRNRVLDHFIGAIGNHSTSDKVDLCGVRPILDDTRRQGVSDALQLLELKNRGGI